MEKILTVVVPTYNMEKYLDRCLTSLVIDEPRMTLLEVLVVNDGSKDRSSEIAHGYEAKYPGTFKVIDKQNGNYGSCINAALPVAQGKYIKVLDADDWFSSDQFASFISYLGTTSADMVLTDMQEVDENGISLSKHILSKILEPDIVLTLEEFASRMIGVGIYMQYVTYKTSLLKSSGYRQTEGISYTDQEWLFFPMSLMASVVYYPVILYSYLVGRIGQTIDESVHQKNMWMEMAGVKVMLREWNDIAGKYDSSVVKNFFLGRIFSRSRAIYVSLLLKNPKGVNMEHLIEFDKFLKKECPLAYEYMGGLSAPLGFKFVSSWRKSYSRNHPLYWVLNLRNRIK